MLLILRGYKSCDDDDSEWIWSLGIYMLCFFILVAFNIPERRLTAGIGNEKISQVQEELKCFCSIFKGT